MNIFGYELTFELSIDKIEGKKKATGFSSKRWSTMDINHLLKRHGEKVSAEDIAKELNRTVPSIHSMLYKLHRKTTNDKSV